MSDIFLIAGLGNPGAQYSATRHNAGFMAADAMAGAWSAEFAPWNKAQADYFKTEINGKTVYVLKPMAYMNLSGGAVSAFANFYKIPLKNILVIFDDMSITLGSLRMRMGGSAGGQNGMRDIIAKLGTQDIPRLRIGIGPKPDFFEGKDFVLSKFKTSEAAALKEVLARAVTAAEDFVKHGIDIAMNKANQH